MEKKRLMARYRYTLPDHKISQTVNLNDFLGELHNIQLDMIEEALEKSDLSEAKAVIKHIMEK